MYLLCYTVSMSESHLPDSQSEGITRKRMQEVLQRDLYNLATNDDPTPRSAVDVGPVVPKLEHGIGRMTLDFSSGNLDVTISTTDAEEAS